ncbi:MAG: adenylate/guanylate cyclase domain-containing protein [Gammaproteobacteria bacterium]
MKFELPTGANRLKLLLTSTVFALFVVNALGLADFHLVLEGRVGVNRQVLGDLLAGRVAAPLLRVDGLVFFVVGAALALLLPALPPIGASMVTLAAMLPPFWVAYAFPVPPPLVPLEYTLLVVLVLFSVNVLASYFIETHERQLLLRAFGQYVPPAVVDELLRHPETYSMQGESRELTVMFCDIKAFSNIAETLEPRALTEMMNRYLSAMTDVLQRHGATIDKYIGDAIMAFWGAPLPQPDHAARAVAAAQAMQRRMVSLREEFVERGWPAIEIGIGINTGTMHVGNMGSRFRIAYTVLGDAVNLAARLEALTRLYRVDTLIAESTFAALPDAAFREIDHVRVKGKGESARIYAPWDGDSVTLAEQQAALEAYYAGDWTEAIARIDALRTAADEADPWCEVMLERMARHEPPPGWDGVISFGGALGYRIGEQEVAA